MCDCTCVSWQERKKRKERKKAIQSLFEQKSFTLDWFVKFLLYFFAAFLQTALFWQELDEEDEELEWVRKEVWCWNEDKEKGTAQVQIGKVRWIFQQKKSKETSFVLFFYLRSTENSLIKLILFLFFFVLCYFSVHLMLHERLWVCMKVCLL